jgi:uncharacterized membrane protein/protein-disulfide isomerase
MPQSQPAMKTGPFWAGCAASSIALAASAVLLVDYVGPAPVFCAADGGCGAVRQTVFAYPLGVPMPLIGIVGILTVSLLAMFAGRTPRIIRAVLASLGAVVAVSLLVVQGTLHTLCPYCAVADVAMVLIAALAVAGAKLGWQPPSHKSSLGIACSVLVLATSAPLAIGALRKPLLPAVVAAAIEAAPAGRTTVIDFVDFECPFCRATHAELQPLLAARRDRVHVVRKQVPLPGHRHALDAARAACCGEMMGKAEEIADALFSAPPSQLTPEGCEQIAAAQGLPVERFRACVRDEATTAKIYADAEAFRAAHGRGLPTLWIGTKLFEGQQDRETLRAALDEAIRAL